MNYLAADNKPIASTIPQGKTIIPDTTTSTPNQQTSTNSPQASTATSTQIQEFIQTKVPSLTSTNGVALFGVTKVVQPLTGWYVVTLSLSGGDDATQIAILQQTGDSVDSLKMVASPNVSFVPDSLKVPDAVRRAL